MPTPSSQLHLIKYHLLKEIAESAIEFNTTMAEDIPASPEDGEEFEILYEVIHSLNTIGRYLESAGTIGEVIDAIIGQTRAQYEDYETAIDLVQRVIQKIQEGSYVV